jgi:DNA-binding transcriptional ArsR family regulator
MNPSSILEATSEASVAGFKALSDPARLRILDLLSKETRCMLWDRRSRQLNGRWRGKNK